MNLWNKLKLGITLILGKTSVPALDQLVQKNQVKDQAVSSLPLPVGTNEVKPVEVKTSPVDWMDYELIDERTLTDAQRACTLKVPWIPELVTGLEITRTKVAPSITVQPQSEHIQFSPFLTDVYPNLCSRVVEEERSYTPETYYIERVEAIDPSAHVVIEFMRPVLILIAQTLMTSKQLQNKDLNLGRGCSNPYMLVDVPEKVIIDCINDMNYIAYEELEKLRLEKYND